MSQTIERSYGSISRSNSLMDIDKTTGLIKNYELGSFFEKCFFDTLERSTTYKDNYGKPFTFIETGDIRAMWLRDSYHQVRPYIPFLDKDLMFKRFVEGVINQQVEFVLRDPYANTHVLNEKTKSPHRFDRTEMKPGVFERKWEPDSLAAFLTLSYEYWKATGDLSFAKDERWQEAAEQIYKTFQREQLIDGSSRYKFKRPGISAILLKTERVRNTPIIPTGMIRATHRPSDDATELPFNVPVNLFVAGALRQLAEMENALGNETLTNESLQLADEINFAIEKYAVVRNSRFGEIYAYEIDGFGNFLLMDDATPPSFISTAPDNDRLRNTRAFVLSEDNPFYLSNGNIEGNGSPHTSKNMLWPISIILRAMTSTNEAETIKCLSMLEKEKQNGTIHESVSIHNRRTTRQEFGMGKSTYASLILQLYKQSPHLLRLISQ